MAFFDELGKRLTSTGQTAVQKTKDVAETARLNSSISDEERERAKCYTEIGKLYAKLHANDYEPEFAPYFEALRRSENSISELKRQIGDIKKVSRCPSCGAELANGMTFCSSCGSKVEAMAAAKSSSSNVCPSCGSAVKPGLSFCTNCGQKVTAGSGGSADFVPAAFAPAASKSKDSGNQYVCPACGRAQKKDLAFCTECGAKMKGGDVQKSKTSPLSNLSKMGSKSSKLSNLSNISKNIPNISNTSNISAASDNCTCPSCGHVQKKGLAFCTECGAGMNSGESGKPMGSPLSNLPIIGNMSDKRTCPECGNVQNKDLAFCTECGCSMERAAASEDRDDNMCTVVLDTSSAVNIDKQIPETDKTVCPVCGNRQNAGLTFCTQCGTIFSEISRSVRSAEVPSPQQTAQPVSYSAPVREPQMRKCPSCGFKQGGELSFCANCGSSMNGQPPKSVRKPDVGATVMLMPDMTAPPMQKPVSAQPATSKPDIGATVMLMPDMTAPPTQKPVSAQPSTSKPDIGATVMLMPDMTAPPTQKPDMSTPATSKPDTGATVMLMPDMTAPPMQKPESNTPANSVQSKDSDATMMLMPDVPLPSIIPFLVRKNNGETYKIDKPECTVGRSKNNDCVIVGNMYIARIHCRIITRGEEYFIVDNDSSNHTYIDGIMIPPNVEMKLSHGNIIKLANEDFEFKIF